MKKHLAALAGMLALGACSGTLENLSSDDPAVRAAAAARVDAIKTVGVTALTNLNLAGVDPLSLDPDDPKDAVRLALFTSLCGLGTGLTTVYRPEAPEITEAGASFCDLVLQAVTRSPFAVPAAPAVAPLPPEPSS